MNLSALPKLYSFLGKLPNLPRTIQEGLALYGTHEHKGKGSNPLILEWVKELNDSGTEVEDYSDDDIPWCGLFAAIVCKRAGKKPVDQPLWALNWAKYGLPTDKPALGDVLSFKRNGGGHVGFYVAEDKEAFHVLGGNQSDQVSITRVAKPRLWAARTHPYVVRPSSAIPYGLNASGGLSLDER